MNDKRKIELLEKFVLQNSILWLDGKGVYSKWDDQIDWLDGFPIMFKVYIRKLHKTNDLKVRKNEQ